MIERYVARFANTHRSVAVARAAVIVYAERCGFTGQDLADLESAVGEALANAAEHGFRDGTFVDVNAYIDGDGLIVDVRDDGPGFAHKTSSTPREPVTGSPRGFGMHIMRMLVDAVEYGDRGRHVRLIKRLPPAATGEDRSALA